MSGQTWGVALTAFLASAVEFVEAFTIVLVAGVTGGWRSALAGAGAAAAVLAVLVATLGTALVRLVPIEDLRLAIGLLLILFGLRWLRKAVLRYGGLLALHDEQGIYRREVERLRGSGGDLGALAVATSFKGVLLEGLEVAFIVITVGAQATAHGLAAATAGAMTAGVLVAAAGMLVRAPLERVPENTLKAGVGVMLATFGTFWAGEGLGVRWPGSDAAIPVLLAAWVLAAAALVGVVRLRVRRHAGALSAAVPAAGTRSAR